MDLENSGKEASADEDNQLVLGSSAAPLDIEFSAGAGNVAVTLPTNPEAFLRVKINGVKYKLALFADP